MSERYVLPVCRYFDLAVRFDGSWRKRCTRLSRAAAKWGRAIGARSLQQNISTIQMPRRDCVQNHVARQNHAGDVREIAISQMRSWPELRDLLRVIYKSVRCVKRRTCYVMNLLVRFLTRISKKYWKSYRRFPARDTVDTVNHFVLIVCQC